MIQEQPLKWIKWNPEPVGNPHPATLDTLVYVRLRSGFTDEGSIAWPVRKWWAQEQPGASNWLHSNHPSDIMEYAIVGIEQPKPKRERLF